ncbi:MAG TPA: GIY-YIG nuclease family protein [Thermoanaerobaculia bacterium]
MRDAYVYMMSNKSHRLYVGATTDLVKRVRQHKEGSYPNGFTARYKFDRLVYFETLDSYVAALARERYLKGLVRVKKVALIQRDNPKWLDLSVNFDDLLMAR